MLGAHAHPALGARMYDVGVIGVIRAIGVVGARGSALDWSFGAGCPQSVLSMFLSDRALGKGKKGVEHRVYLLIKDVSSEVTEIERSSYNDRTHLFWKERLCCPCGIATQAPPGP